MVLTSLWNIGFPAVCSGCRRPLPQSEGSAFCAACLAEVAYICSPLCVRCGAELSRDGGGGDRWCGSCLKNHPAFDFARSLVWYREPASSLLLKLKFHADTRTVGGLLQLIRAAPGRIEGGPYDLIVPVPLHPSRLRSRGLNQALILAGLLFGDWRGKIEPAVLIRVENSVPQTRLSGASRRTNLKKAFAVNARFDVVNRSICIVDDVYTTGTTVSECAKTLKRGGARRIDVWTFARA
ncbi:MAG: ComF family protein [Desulfofustis sp.]|nr:ComF family protein [Desulfofustis sp.]